MRTDSANHTYFFTRRDELVRNVCTHELVRERDVFAGLLVHGHRLDPADDTAELTSTAGLLLVRVGEVGTATDCLAESDTRLASGTLDAIFTTHALDIDLKMKFTHPGNNSLKAAVSLCDGSCSRRAVPLWTLYPGAHGTLGPHA